jgi:catechol 2,3-dioxygenase-like lactoylglutathione lyase family enzyme
MALAHITLATRDVRRSAVFFEETLGWRPIARPANIDRPAAWLAIAPGMELHLVEDLDFEPSRFEREFGRHIAVTFPLAAFPALQERLQARGATLIEPLRDTPFQRFFFRDPNGYVFEVVEEERTDSEATVQPDGTTSRDAPTLEGQGNGMHLVENSAEHERGS